MRELSCADGLVCRWISGEREPSASQAAFLEKNYGIEATWWGEPAKPVRKRTGTDG